MSPVLPIAVPIVLIIVGMILNGLNVSLEQPSSPSEQDRVKRLTAEKEMFREAFYGQRERAAKRQQRVKLYSWLLLFATVGSSIWAYVNTTKQAALSNRIAALQTLGTEEGKQEVLSVTLLDGDNSKYLIKADKTVDTAAAEAAKQKLSSWELNDLGTALISGSNSLPLGVSVKITNSN